MATKMMPNNNQQQQEEDDEYYRTRYSTVPVPDPTLLTTKQMNREVMSLREIIEARLDGMDKALVLVQEMLNRSPTIPEVVAKTDERFTALERHVQHAITQAKELQEQKVAAQGSAYEERIKGITSVMNEKFDSIATQFTERDTRTDQTSKDSKVAVDAALQAAKEAVGEQNKSNALSISKSEATFTKQIDQIGVIISTTTKGVDDKIDDIKGRLTTIESRTLGATSATSNIWGWIFGAFGLLAAFSTIVLMVLHFVGKV